MKVASGRFLLLFVVFKLTFVSLRLTGRSWKDATRMRRVSGGCATDKTPELSSKQDNKWRVQVKASRSISSAAVEYGQTLKDVFSFLQLFMKEQDFQNVRTPVGSVSFKAEEA